jgi:hypothetical protein
VLQARKELLELLFHRARLAYRWARCYFGGFR